MKYISVILLVMYVTIGASGPVAAEGVQTGSFASLLSKGAATQKSIYLVGLKKGVVSSPVKAFLQARRATLVSELPAIGGLVVRTTADVAKALASLPAVEFVEADTASLPDRPVLRSTATSTPTLALPSYLSTDPWKWQPSNPGPYDWWAVALNVPSIHTSEEIPPTKGAGVAICAIDSGLDANHPEFYGAVDADKFKDFSNDPVPSPYEPNDERGHGTQTIGISYAQEGTDTLGSALRLLDRDMDGGTGTGMNETGITGIAPEATLYVAKFGDEYSSTFKTYVSWRSDLIESLEWCTRLLGATGTERHVVITTTVTFSNASKLEQRAIAHAWNQGALIVASMGNSGTEVSDYPAADDDVIGVGGVNLYGQAWEWASYGPATDLIAPSVHVVTTVTPGTVSGNFYVPAVSNAELFGYYSTVVTGSNTNAYVMADVVAADSGDKATLEFCQDGETNPDLQGKIALIERGGQDNNGETCTYAEKVDNAIASGATAVLLFDNTPELESSGYSGATLNLSEGETVSIPVLMTSYEIGEAIYAKTPTSGSTLVQPADYIVNEGTSFSSPMVGAAAALVWSDATDLGNEDLANLLRGTANTLGQTQISCTGSSEDVPDPHYGCGLIDPLAAIKRVQAGY